MRRAGAAGKENVGISNDNVCRNIHTENPRIPQQRYTTEGKPGTKGNPKGAPDDEAVKIPPPALQEIVRPGSDTAAC